MNCFANRSTFLGADGRLLQVAGTARGKARRRALLVARHVRTAAAQIRSRLDHGAHSKVWLVMQRSIIDKGYFALKVLSKARLVRAGEAEVQSVLCEKRALLCLQPHPYVASLQGASDGLRTRVAARHHEPRPGAAMRSLN